MAKSMVKMNSEDAKREIPTLKIVKEYDIAMDFAEKVYKKIGTPIKSIVLFGSASKGIASEKSDIDIMIIIDDSTINWDNALISWYREELGKVIRENPYVKELHVNTVRLTTWWSEMMRGEPVVINIIRSGIPLIDFGGFFAPLKSLLVQGKIKSTPEMIYITLGRAPVHLTRAKVSMLNSMEAVYWAMVDASHAALIAAKQLPPSPEHIPDLLKEVLVDKNLINRKFLDWYKDVYIITHKIMRGEAADIKGHEVQIWRERADEYVGEMARVVKKMLG